MRLVSSLWLDPKEGDEAHIPFEALLGADGLIALTGGPDGPIDRALGAHMPDLAQARLERLAAGPAARPPPATRQQLNKRQKRTLLI